MTNPHVHLNGDNSVFRASSKETRDYVSVRFG
jgi:hypothetical protein